MKKVLILGANGRIARVATKLFLERTDAQLTLYLRKANRLRLTDVNSSFRHMRPSTRRDSKATACICSPGAP
jgi:saccharopine dehydrogenase-like NADP-dependent oxidoreductase